MRRLRRGWTCSNYAHHQHRYRWTAWLCGRAQWLAAIPSRPTVSEEKRAFERDLRAAGHSISQAKRLTAEHFRNRGH